jgi:serine/threonine-protein kinase
MLPPTPANPWLGVVLDGRFRIVEQLGVGGMGGVYLAEQLDVGRRVVVKVILGDLARDPEMTERFRREVLVLARLRHPNVVQVYASGQAPDGSLWVAMEHVPGRTLAEELVRGGPMNEPRALHVAEQIAGALAAAHAAGVVHRDLKPANVMLTDLPGSPDHVAVLDFGIAKLAAVPSSDSSLTRAGSLVGTPAYMSPEQIQGLPDVDGRADVYGLGVILYEMLTGRNPFGAASAVDCFVLHLQSVPPPLRSQPVTAGVSPALESVLARCLEKHRERRFANAQELQGVLRGLASPTLPAVAHPPTVTLPGPGGAPKTVVFVLGLVAAGLVAAIVTTLALRGGDEAPPPTRDVLLVRAPDAGGLRPPGPEPLEARVAPPPSLGRTGPLPLAIPGPDGAVVARNADALAVAVADAGAAAPDGGAEETTGDGSSADAPSDPLDGPAEAIPPDAGAPLPPHPVLVDNGVFGEPVPVGALLVLQMGDNLVKYWVDYPWEEVGQAYADRLRGTRAVFGWHRDMDPPYFGVMDPHDVLPHGMMRIEAGEDDGRGTTIAVFSDR